MTIMKVMTIMKLQLINHKIQLIPIIIKHYYQNQQTELSVFTQ